MPRRQRLVAPNVPLHIIQRGNNRQNCFFATSDYLVYLDLLKRSASRTGCAVHAYVLMSNHVHILISPAIEVGPGEMMKAVGERYVQYINQTYNRTGTLWEGRFRSCLVQDETYLLICHRYIELNPVRAGMVSHPSLYNWSSYRCNAYGDANELITSHPLFDSLGNDQYERALAYRDLFRTGIKEQEVSLLRDATNYNYAFGDAAFAETMGLNLGRQVARVSRSRKFAQH
jgi:putative transposase